MLTFKEFLETAKAGDIFQFFAEGDDDFKGNSSINEGQGSRCIVESANPLNHHRFVQWHFENGDETWCFYQSNYADRMATYRILETKVVIPEGLPQWEKDLYESDVPVNEQPQIDAALQALREKLWKSSLSDMKTSEFFKAVKEAEQQYQYPIVNTF